MGRVTLLFFIRTARRRARRAAIAEAVRLLHDLDAVALEGGPRSDEPGVFWISVPEERLIDVADRLPSLGYTERVETPEGKVLYQEDARATRERAPDRRTFLLDTTAGVRAVVGYRGTGARLAKRGLPPYDARLLVNLVRARGVLLDPFAGVGGIVIEADGPTVTVDVDPSLRFGLAALATLHVVADASALPLRDESVSAVATEPPYDEGLEALIAGSVTEAARVLRPGGRAAYLLAEHQADAARHAAALAGLRLELDEPIDRKGLAVVLLCLSRP